MLVHGYTIFCDDIRYEVGGKITYVGCYNAALFHNLEYPTEIQKLCLVVHTLIDPAKVPSQVELRVLNEPAGEILFQATHELGEVDANAVMAANPMAGPDEQYLALITHVILSPLLVDRDTRILARGFLDGTEIKLGSLSITRNVTPNEGT